MMAETEKFEIKPYSKQELADLYKIGVRSLSTWLKPFEKEIGKRYGRYYNIKQVSHIFDKLGLPLS
jgi:transposase